MTTVMTMVLAPAQPPSSMKTIIRPGTAACAMAPEARA